MRTEQIKIFQFKELSDAAKENARSWWRGCADTFEYADCIYEDAERIAKILGIEFSQEMKRNIHGHFHPARPKIWFSGFSSQGDGACFEGSYRYSKGATKEIRQYAPQDKTLHGIADALLAAQKPNFFRLKAECTHSGRYYHSGCMQVSVEDCEYPWRDIGVAEDQIKEALRSFADWIYARLKEEHDFFFSEENVEENIICNGYEFTENGSIH